MKNRIIVIFMTMTIISAQAMDSDCSSGSRRDGPQSPKWMDEAKRLAHDLAPFLERSPTLTQENDGAVAQEELGQADSLSDEEHEENKFILHEALEIYKKAVPCSKEEKLNGPCLQAVSNKMNHKDLTVNKIVAAAWLQLVGLEHKDYFKKQMLEWAIIEKHKETVKYLVVKEKVSITTPNLVGSVPVVLACEVGDVAIFKFLLKKGALEGGNKKNIYLKVIEVATRYNRIDILDELKPKNSSSRCVIH